MATTPTMRDIAAIAFRHRQLMAISFLGVFLGAVLCALLIPSEYEAGMKILVKQERVDPVVSAEANIPAQFAHRAVTEEELNSEVQLITSRDLLEKVVIACELDSKGLPLWSRVMLRGAPHEAKVARAVRQLEKDLDVEPMRKSNLIEVTYTSSDPQLAAQVLRKLSEYYQEKHLAVHRPAGALEFFQRQTEQYRQRLSESQRRLGEFSKQQGTIAAQLERDNALVKVNEFETSLRQTMSAIAEARNRIRTLEQQAGTTPERVVSAERNVNAQLLTELKSKLLGLELKRTELLAKYSPTYKLVVDVDAQIQQTREALAAEEAAPVREITTNQNPTSQWIAAELAKARTELASLQARAVATERTVSAYRQSAAVLDEKRMQQDDLLRAAKTEEANYLLYMNKLEEARISDAMDSKRILNVTLAEAPTVPDEPLYSGLFLMLLGTILAGMASVGSAVVADYLDPSFRTPAELEAHLHLPALAAIPEERT
ncbi:MAG TPA: Wzz/FepE/Etk N-terminal domain-containing protein [Terriglobales bacterium]|nr:Wzz/FepE/Etk N-terminal domain-containing protein [Terriglobales bacterium]